MSSATFLKDIVAAFSSAPAGLSDSTLSNVRLQILQLKHDAGMRIEQARISRTSAAKRDFALYSTSHAVLELIDLYKFSVAAKATDDLPTIAHLLAEHVSALLRDPAALPPAK